MAPTTISVVTLRLRNTLSRAVEPVEPLEPGRVRMYTCGPTVYRYAHVGNLRSYLLADLIRRVLLYHGLDVLHVKNITDVGHLREDQFDRGEVESDKRDPADFALWKAAGPESGRDMRWPSRWGEGFPGWHLECSAMALRHLGPTFDVHTGGEDNVFPHHEDEIAQSAPIAGGPPARIWIHGAHLLMSGRKMSKSAGNFQRITELAEGGVDPLAFRYLCLTARYAKQLNFSESSIAGAAAGLASLRAELGALGPAPSDGPWAPPAVLEAGASPDRPAGRADGVAGHGTSGSSAGDGGGSGFQLLDRAGAPAAPLSNPGRAIHDRFVAAIDDDLDTPTALRIARETLRSDLPADERRWLVLDMDVVLGLDLHRSVAGTEASAAAPAELPIGALELVAARTAARAAHDWSTADRLREELRGLGVDVIDRPDGGSETRPID
jgi:cysteinyl-tRNA synthetase